MSGSGTASAAARGAWSATRRKLGIDQPGRAQDHPQVPQLGELEHRSLDAEARERADKVGHRLGHQLVAAAEHRGHLTDQRQLFPDPVEVGGRPAFAHARGTERPRGVARHRGQHLVELEIAERGRDARPPGKRDGVPAACRLGTPSIADCTCEWLTRAAAPRARSG